jgi:hypothetical protein
MTIQTRIHAYLLIYAGNDIDEWMLSSAARHSMPIYFEPR